MPDKDPKSENPPPGHETRDVYIGSVVKFAVGLAVFVLVVHGIVALLLGGLRRDVRDTYTPLAPLAARERLQLPRDLRKVPSPQLQESDERELAELRAEEEAKLRSYGVVDSGKGVYRIPIERAIDILADPEQARAHGIHVRPVEKKGQR